MSNKTNALRLNFRRSRADEPGLFARQPVLGLGLAAAGGLVFAILAYNVVTHGPLLAWDMPIDQALHQRAVQLSPFLFTLVKIAGALGRETAIIVTALFGVHWLIRRRWRPLTLLLTGTIGGEVWFEVLSRLFNRHRPVWPDPLDPLPGPGFPSGHSQTAVLLYGLLFYLLAPHLRATWQRVLAGAITLAIALLIGIARLLMGAHYPTDVLAGYAFGFFWGGLVYTGLELYFARRRA